MNFVRSLYTIGEDVKILQPTVVLAVPLLAEKIYDRIDAKLKESKVAQMLMKVGLKNLVFKNVKKGLGGKLRFMVVGGAPCPSHVLKGYKGMGITVLEGYGLTECAPVVSIAGSKYAKIGTIGFKLPNIEIRLADKNEQGVGELQIKGPITMKGYWHNDAATRKRLTASGSRRATWLRWMKTGSWRSVAARRRLS
jgi:long-chain acyl-CoA synthetase